jgi:hypothetical protein
MATMKATATITVAEGYEAMRIFLEAVCRRHGMTGDEIDFIMGGLRWADETPVDPTMWEDWLAAIERYAADGRRETGVSPSRHLVRNAVRDSLMAEGPSFDEGVTRSVLARARG